MTTTLLHHHLAAAAQAWPQKTAVVVAGGRISYAELLAKSQAVAQALAAGGVVRGDRVALFLDNSVEFIAGLYGCLVLGAAFMPINPLTKEDKLAYMLADAGATGLITHAALAPVWEPARASSRSVHTLLVAGGDGWPQPAADVPDDAGSIDRDLACLIYTSGSTGLPKGVMLTHLNMLSAGRSISSYLGLRHEDVIHCALPLAFDYGLYQALMAVRLGATLVLEANFAFPVRALQTLARERVTVFPGVPTMFAMLLALQDLARFDLSALRLITNTAAALSQAHVERLRALFPQATLYSMYGLTECKRVSFLPPEQLELRPTSVGRGMPNQEHWLVDDAGRRLPFGATGELVVRGSHVMAGYWGKPQETAQRLKPGPLPGEQVLHTGDLFRTDAEGWLYFVARRDDIIKTRGEKVSPREVENVIHQLAAVLEVAVVGVPDPLLGEAVKAFVRLCPGAAVTPAQIIGHCLAHLENFMVPKTVELVAELPKTDTGKIRKVGLAKEPL